jgi:hypothetical protein
MSLTKIIHDISTGEITESNLNEQELLVVKANAEHGKKIEKQNKAEAEAKEIARQAIADRLGLTADELKLLLG